MEARGAASGQQDGESSCTPGAQHSCAARGASGAQNAGIGASSEEVASKSTNILTRICQKRFI